MLDRPRVPLRGTRSGPLDLAESLSRRGISRRQFMQFCSAMAATLALPASAVPDIARALQAARRPPALYFEFQDCAGCIEALLRSPHPTVTEIVLDLLSLNYQETIMAAAGEAAEAAAAATIEEGGYLLMVEGAIPLKDDGVYCCIAGRTALDIVQEAATTAVAAIATGNCASFGNIAAANPNPTGAVGLREVVRNIPVVNMAGCPPNAVNLAALITHYLTFQSLPALDHHARPTFAYGIRIHDHCPNRPHFDAGQFVEKWGDEGHRLSWCLYKMGCKGPQTYHNCPVVEYNEGTSWPIESGHPCVGCSEPQFWDTMTPFYRRLPEVAGLTVETNVDTIGLVLTGVTVAAIGAHAVGSALRKRRALPAADARLSEGAVIDEPPPSPRVVDQDVEQGDRDA